MKRWKRLKSDSFPALKEKREELAGEPEKESNSKNDNFLALKEKREELAGDTETGRCKTGRVPESP